MLRKVLPVFALLFLFFAAATATFAQETPPEEPDGPSVPISPEQEAEIEAAAKARYDDFLSRSIFDYRVAYLIKDDLLKDKSLVSGANIAAISGAVLISSWDEFAQSNAEQPFQVVLLHQSMVGEIDLEWAREAYRSGVIIVGMNVEVAQLAEIVGDFCMAKEHKTNFGDRDSYVYLIYVVLSAQAEALSSIHAAALETCSDAAITAGAGIIHGAAASYIESPSDLEGLIGSIVLDTMNYGMPNPRNNQLLPLPQD